MQNITYIVFAMFQLSNLGLLLNAIGFFVIQK